MKSRGEDHEVRARLVRALEEVRAELKPEPDETYEAQAHRTRGDVDVKLARLASDLTAGHWTGRSLAGYPPGEER